MSDPQYERSPIETDPINDVVMAANQPTSPPDECFMAKVLRAAFDMPPERIPEDFEALNFDRYTCSFVRANGKECTLADPIIFLRHNVGLVAVGSRNFCGLELDSPQGFKKATTGSIAVRAVRFGKKLKRRFVQ